MFYFVPPPPHLFGTITLGSVIEYPFWSSPDDILIRVQLFGSCASAIRLWFQTFEILPVTLFRVDCPSLALRFQTWPIRSICSWTLHCWIHEFTNLIFMSLFMSKTCGGNVIHWQLIWIKVVELWRDQLSSNAKKKLLNKREWFRGDGTVVYLNVWPFLRLFLNQFYICIYIYIYVYICSCPCVCVYRRLYLLYVI